jgi:hypothetical protein
MAKTRLMRTLLFILVLVVVLVVVFALLRRS